MVEVSEKDGAVTFRARVQPRASESRIAGEQNGAIKIRIAAPPVDGKANEECRRFLAKTVGVRRDAVEIIAGGSAREKIIRIKNISAERLREALGRVS